MIRGIGIDIIELIRIERSINKGNQLVNRVLTTREKELFNKLNSERRKVEFLAGRFAAKEAFAKATGRGIGELSFQHIEVLSNKEGAPYLTANGYEEDNLFVSITHSHDYAAAQAIIEKK